MAGLRKVTFFDKAGVQPKIEDEDGQAKPNVYGVRWVNQDTFETIRVRGGARTGPHGEVLQPVEPTLDLTAFVTARLDKAAPPPARKDHPDPPKHD
ncbi:MAG TPA: hypothetical protein VMT64_02255 [Candidatus Binataceae bacterium]|nr:hypothetical protein [Candidatus Binataceae bacterium]